MRSALLFVVALAALSGVTALLDEVIRDSVRRFNDTQDLKKQLRYLLNASFDVAQQHVEDSVRNEALELARHLRNHNISRHIDRMIHAARNHLDVLERVGQDDSTLTLVARRMILASIMLRWMSLGAPLDQRGEKHLREVVTQFYRMHCNSLARKGLMEYLHISKSGGSSFSTAARRNNCSTASRLGKLQSLDDNPRWINGTAFAEVTGGANIMWSMYGQVLRTSPAETCRDRVAMERLHGYSFVSNEYTLLSKGVGTEPMLCRQVANVVSLREPGARLVSHMHYMLGRMKRRMRFLTKRKTRAEARAANGARPKMSRAEAASQGDQLFHRLFCSGNVTVWERVTPAVVDNYITRSFLGEKGFHSPVGAVGSAALAVAVRQLLQYDLVLDLGAGDEAAATIMRQGLGWNVTLAEVQARTYDLAAAGVAGYSRDECPNEELLRALLPRQWPDRALYGLGRVVSFLDRLLFALAHNLGLQPTLYGGTRLERSAATLRCGLLDSQPVAAVPAEAKAAAGQGRGPAGGKKTGGADEGEGDTEPPAAP